MKTAIVIFIFTVLQQAFSQCLPAAPLCLSPPALDILPATAFPLPLPAPSSYLPPGLDLPALAPLLASTLSASLAATLPPLLEAALPTVLTSALAAAGPLLEGLPCGPLPISTAPIVYTAPASCASPASIVYTAPASCAPPAPIVYGAPAPATPYAPSCAPSPMYYSPAPCMLCC